MGGFREDCDLTGKEQNLALRQSFRQKNRKVDAVHLGKNDVEDGKVGRPLSDNVKCLFRKTV